MSRCTMLIASAKIPPGKKKRFRLALDKNFCLIPPPLTQRQLKQRQRTKNNKTTISASPKSVFHARLAISKLKNK